MYVCSTLLGQFGNHTFLKTFTHMQHANIETHTRTHTHAHTHIHTHTHTHTHARTHTRTHALPQMENQVIVSDYSQMDRILREERQYILDICKKVKKAGCNVLLIQKSILRCLPVLLCKKHLLNCRKIVCVYVYSVCAFTLLPSVCV